MKTLSRLLVLDVWLDCDLQNDHIALIEEYVKHRFTVVNSVDQVFTPYGLTKILILSESHCAIHTYPEHRYFSLDLFICKPALDLEKIAEELLSELPVAESRFKILNRGS